MMRKHIRIRKTQNTQQDTQSQTGLEYKIHLEQSVEKNWGKKKDTITVFSTSKHDWDVNINIF